MIKNESDFIAWLDQQLNVEIPDQIVAFNINVYESPFNIEVLGSNEFTPDDEDWACNEDWVPEKRIMPVSAELFGDSWENALENLVVMAKSYVSSKSKNVAKLKSSKAFAIGFVDGSLSYVL